MTKTEAQKELRRLATKVWFAQDACNLSGVVAAFRVDMRVLRQALEADKGGPVGTDEMNTHPVCVLYADKIGHLTGHQAIGGDAIDDAYKWVMANKD